MVVKHPVRLSSVYVNDHNSDTGQAADNPRRKTPSDIPARDSDNEEAESDNEAEGVENFVDDVAELIEGSEPGFHPIVRTLYRTVSLIEMLLLM